MNGPAFSVRVTEEDGRTVLWAAGELDLIAVPAMDRALSAAPAGPGRRLIVDLSRVGFLDAAGVRLLAAADDRRRGVGGGGLAVRGARGIVRRILELMQLPWLPDQAEPAPRGMPQQVARLDLARQTAALSVTELYVAYFALGGTAELGEVAAYLAGDPDTLNVHQRALAVQAVNERLLDLGRADRLISFSPD